MDDAVIGSKEVCLHFTSLECQKKEYVLAGYYRGFLW
jgi:hypothetical protein